jgi:hypothetical protein
MDDSTDVFGAVKEQAREQDGEHTVIIEVDCDPEDFSRQILPFAIGYMSSTHGLTNVGFAAQRLVFERTAEVDK